MSGHVELSTRATKDLRRLDRSVQERIARVLRAELAIDPRPSNLDVVRLEGRALWSRLRVGDYRVILSSIARRYSMRVLGPVPEGYA